jgi:hypothetical protein
MHLAVLGLFFAIAAAYGGWPSVAFIALLAIWPCLIERRARLEPMAPMGKAGLIWPRKPKPWWRIGID